MMGALVLRPARLDDARAVWEWLQDPAVREAAFSSDPIPWETHEPWFQARLARTAEPYLIAEDAEGRRVGQVRFERSSGRLEVSIVVDPGSRGRGLGRRMLSDGCALARRSLGPGPIEALARAGNPASLKAFEAAGFVRAGTRAVRGSEAVVLVLPG